MAPQMGECHSLEASHPSPANCTFTLIRTDMFDADAYIICHQCMRLYHSVDITWLCIGSGLLCRHSSSSLCALKCPHHMVCLHDAVWVSGYYSSLMQAGDITSAHSHALLASTLVIIHPAWVLLSAGIWIFHKLIAVCYGTSACMAFASVRWRLFRA